LFPKKSDSIPEKEFNENVSIETKGNSLENFKKKYLNFEDFQKIELKVGQIRACRKVKKSSKLLCSEIDLGEEQLRTIISGAAKFYSPEDLIGRSVIVVANLKPVKFMGELSEGMILFSDDNGKLVLIEAPNNLNPGVDIH